VNPGKQTLEVAGTAGALQQAFHTTIHKYAVNGQQHFSNTQDPQIPVALAPVLGGFVSLNNFPIRHYSRFLGSAQYNPKTQGQADYELYPLAAKMPTAFHDI
jgi:trimeric autotransporter adhesin